jgi:hypothetical protein
MQIDPQLGTLGISVNQTTGAQWHLSVAQYQDETQSGGNHHIYFTVLDKDNNPIPNAICVVDWVGREPGDPPTKVITDASGQANVPIYANLDIHLLNGPYFAFVEDTSKSDVVRGMGLPEKHHVNFLLTFGLAQTPISLEDAILAAAQKLTWMPINTDGALYKFAQKQNLGYPQTDEFEFAYGTAVYVGQVYNLGIVYVKKGDWGNCKWVKKP